MPNVAQVWYVDNDNNHVLRITHSHWLFGHCEKINVLEAKQLVEAGYTITDADKKSMLGQLIDRDYDIDEDDIKLLT